MMVRLLPRIPSLVALCVAQGANERDKWLGVDLTKLDRDGCNEAIKEIGKLIPPIPSQEPIWTERKGTQTWLNGAVPVDKFSNDTSHNTLYGGDAFKPVTLELFESFISGVYCNGAEGKKGVQPQPQPFWANDQCHYTTTLPLISGDKLERVCGCKNQPPTANNSTQIVNRQDRGQTPGTLPASI